MAMGDEEALQLCFASDVCDGDLLVLLSYPDRAPLRVSMWPAAWHIACLRHVTCNCTTCCAAQPRQRLPWTPPTHKWAFLRLDSAMPACAGVLLPAAPQKDRHLLLSINGIRRYAWSLGWRTGVRCCCPARATWPMHAGGPTASSRRCARAATLGCARVPLAAAYCRCGAPVGTAWLSTRRSSATANSGRCGHRQPVNAGGLNMQMLSASAFDAEAFLGGIPLRRRNAYDCFSMKTSRGLADNS